MAKNSHRSFTLRVDTPFYLELAEKAQTEAIPLNQLANRLLRLGMGKHISLDSAMRSMLMDKMVAGGPADDLPQAFSGVEG